MPLTRRRFVAAATALFAHGKGLRSQIDHQSGNQTGAARTRINVALVDRDRILASADEALTHPPLPLTSLPESASPGKPNEFFSSAAVRRHSDALLDFSLLVPALAAGATVTRETDPERARRYRAAAIGHLDAWFVTPATRMAPSLEYAEMLPDGKPNPEGLLETSGLAEVAAAIPFLELDPAIYKPWFAEYLTWLTESRVALLARDRKDRHGCSWMLQVSAFARATGNEAQLVELRHRFKTVTIRSQINSAGLFARELSTPYPYRNSLFSLDMMAGAAVLLSTRFDSLWEHELQDGPGMRAAIARHAAYIERRSAWPYPADLTHFNDLPCRRPALLFAARAYAQPDYAALWQSLKPAEPAAPELLRTFPIRQPLLWTAQPRPYLGLNPT